MSETTIVPDKTQRKMPQGRLWQKGQPSPNPGGRPKGLMSLVQGKTKQGHELVDIMVNVMKGEKFTVTFTVPTEEGPITVEVERRPSIRERMEAVAWLADRGWGKPVQQVDVTQNKPFIVQHRAFAPGQDPLALPEGEERGVEE